MKNEMISTRLIALVGFKAQERIHEKLSKADTMRDPETMLVLLLKAVASSEN